jgi:hypothetical protein
MEFQDVIRRRRMVRAYTGEPVAEESVERILAAANKAPSAGFSQGYALMTLQGPEQLGPFWELLSHYHGDEDNSGSSFDPVTRAPVVVVPLSCKDIYLDRYARQDKGWTDRDEAHWPVPYWDIDTGFTAPPAARRSWTRASAHRIPACLHQIGEFRALRSAGSYLPIGARPSVIRIPRPTRGGSAKVIKRRSLTSWSTAADGFAAGVRAEQMLSAAPGSQLGLLEVPWSHRGRCRSAPDCRPPHR